MATADVVINAVILLSDGRTGKEHPDASNPSAINDVFTAVVSNF